MTHADYIHKATLDTVMAAQLAEQSGKVLCVNQFWKSETTVYTLEDGSQLAFSGPDFYVVPGGRQGEMIIELMEIREKGATKIWYGDSEQAEQIAIDEAISEIARMDPDAIGECSWGEWSEWE